MNEGELHATVGITQSWRVFPFALYYTKYPNEKKRLIIIGTAVATFVFFFNHLFRFRPDR